VIQLVDIRKANLTDFESIWEIFHQVVQAGDTYTFAPDTSKQEAQEYWMSSEAEAYVALDDEVVLGTYILKPNQFSLGNHVANAAFMVSPNAHGQGIGRAMAEHSLEEAKRVGFSAMQFNFVVETNTGAIALWKNLGFEIVGTLPKVFRHSEVGLVDAYVMHRFL
jgi:L-amino acid N-acyltransferase YncA